MQQVYIGVDVGTSSTRAGVFDEKGKLLGIAKHSITTWHEAGDIVEQSSSDIWHACTAAVRAAMALVAIAPDGAPVSVSGSGEARRNVIVWMDHRAVGEAREINDTQDDVLRYVGGSISPEMQIPKLLWLKRNRRE